MLDHIPDAEFSYMFKDGRDVPPVDVDGAHDRLLEYGLEVAAAVRLLERDGGLLEITFDQENNVSRQEWILYAWVAEDVIVRLGSSQGVFYKRFCNDYRGGEEKYVSPAIRRWPTEGTPTTKDEAQLWVTIFRRAGGRGFIYAKHAEFVESNTGKRLVCPEEKLLLKRHHPALNRSDR